MNVDALLGALVMANGMALLRSMVGMEIGRRHYMLTIAALEMGKLDWVVRHGNYVTDHSMLYDVLTFDDFFRYRAAKRAWRQMEQRDGA